MRLIDADKLKGELKLKELSHIIKQEEYLDYVLNEWKTRVVELGSYNVIEEIESAPEVKAIPIEWLKKWANDNSNGEWSVEYRTVFNGILKDWENNKWQQ